MLCVRFVCRDFLVDEALQLYMNTYYVQLSPQAVRRLTAANTDHDDDRDEYNQETKKEKRSRSIGFA